MDGFDAVRKLGLITAVFVVEFDISDMQNPPTVFGITTDFLC